MKETNLLNSITSTDPNFNEVLEAMKKSTYDFNDKKSIGMMLSSNMNNYKLIIQLFESGYNSNQVEKIIGYKIFNDYPYEILKCLKIVRFNKINFIMEKYEEKPACYASFLRFFNNGNDTTLPKLKKFDEAMNIVGHDVRFNDLALERIIKYHLGNEWSTKGIANFIKDSCK